MAITLAFDVYGTLIDTTGITSALKEYVGESASQFSTIWREKQLEYSFRRGLMQNYRKFSVCTKESLEYTCMTLGIELSADNKNELMLGYRKLPAFSDAEEALPQLQSAGFRLFAFSNGPAEDVSALLENSGIAGYFKDVVSTDEIKSFKPNPAVYAYFLRKSGAKTGEAWLVSGNSFDVIGAISAGMNGAWVRRLETTIFDPWEIEPSVTVKTLKDLQSAVQGYSI